VRAQRLDDSGSPIFWFDFSAPFDENPGKCGLEIVWSATTFLMKDED
jgi:hypothetical protein